MALGREELRELAVTKVNDAKLLFDCRRFSNSYYLFGYGVEIGLKACISRAFVAESIPDRRFVNDIFSHDLTKLVGLSGLGAILEASKDASPQFAAYWATVLDWSEEARYETVDEFRATAMHDAMLHSEAGVFQWLRTNW